MEWKVVADASGPLEAAIIAGRLEVEGIPVWVRREPAGAAIGLTYGPLGRTEILVPADRYGQALELLSTSSDDSPEDIDRESDGVP